MGGLACGGREYISMNITEILAIIDAPIFAGILFWIVKVEVRLMRIETTCSMNRKQMVCDAEGK